MWQLSSSTSAMLPGKILTDFPLGPVASIPQVLLKRHSAEGRWQKQRKKTTLRILKMSWGVKNTFFEAPGVSLGGSGVSIGGVKILRVTCNWKILMFNRNDLQMMDVPLSIYLCIYIYKYIDYYVPIVSVRPFVSRPPAGKCLSVYVSKYQSNYSSYPWWNHVWYIYLHEWLSLMVKCGKCIANYTTLGFYGILFSQLHQLFFLPCPSPSQYPQTKQKNNAWKSLIPLHIFAKFFQGESVVQFYRDFF